MEDILYLLVMAVIMIAGAVSSANKKKKEREAAARKAPQDTFEEVPVPEQKFARKSIGEILEELANQPEYGTEPEPAKIQGDYCTPKAYVHEEGGRMTQDIVNKYTVPDRRIVVPVAEPMPTQAVEAQHADTLSLKEILGEEFDLRRAVIESEILKPKFEQY